jgi:7,8-dihydro-6-hydroxymethylpterin dimethyltransferase
MHVFHHTQALCGKCRRKVTARAIEIDGRVYLEKFCPEHGLARALIASDAAWYRDSIRYVKPRQKPLDINVREFRGCPESCGSCPEHQQHTCLPVIEITGDCNLECPVCLKGPATHYRMTPDEFGGILDSLQRCEGRIDVLNLSGGEPTLHPQLETLLRMAGDKGVTQVTVSTNGIPLLRNPALRSLFRHTGTIAALQFDGFRSHTYEMLRGADLAAGKLALIRLLEEEDVRYSLVTTLAQGVNADEVTDIVDFFFAGRGISLMFQPVSLTGYAAKFPETVKLTIPDVVHAIERSRHVKPGDFNPLPCSHYSCFALAYYFILGNDRFLSLKEFLGAPGYLDVIANKTLPGLDEGGFDVIRNRLYDIWSLSDAGSLGDQVLRRVQDTLRAAASGKLDPKRLVALGAESMKAIFVHDFMDAATLDFGRLIKCCNPYPQTDGRLVPMCAQNVFFSETHHA